MDDATLSAGADDSQGEERKLGAIVAAIEPLLGAIAGEPQALEGGITNRNFRAELGGREYVIRIPGSGSAALGINRAAEREANQLAAEAGIAPPVAAALDDPACLVTEFIEGRELGSEELRDEAIMAEVARALRTLHESGRSIPADFRTVSVVSAYADAARSRGGRIPGAYGPALECAERITAALGGPEHEPVACHNDLLAANFLHDGERVRIVDWEYAGMGDRYFDLANFVVNNELSEAEAERLLGVYLEGTPEPKQLAALGLMRFMSDFREAMWGVVQSCFSDLDFDFDGYADRHFKRMGETMDDPGFEAMLETARG